jgi:hypothetical protein
MTFEVEFPGPFTHHEVIVGGWKVPLVEAHPTGGHDDKITLVIDGRFAETFTVEEAERFVPFLADAIAVALGYTGHPRGDEEPITAPQPRPVRMYSITSVHEEEREHES